jgi:predicted phage-related endonuclease
MDSTCPLSGIILFPKELRMAVHEKMQVMKPFTIHKVDGESERSAWLNLRKQFVTATDWPQITGTSPWGDAQDVMLEKASDLVEDEGGEIAVPLRVGKQLEPIIAKAIKKQWGRGQYLCPAFVTRRHLGFTPDLARIDIPTGWLLGEIKVSVKDWRGTVPPNYLDQVKFQATVLGINQVQIIHLHLSSWTEGDELTTAGVLPPGRLEWFEVLVSERERASIERRSERWWQMHVQPHLSNP